MKKIELLGVNITSVSESELGAVVRKWLAENEQRLILNVNIHGMNLSRKHRWMKALFNDSDVLLCDGMGVLWASKLQGEGIVERIALTDWGWPLAGIMEESGSSVFLLGCPEEIVTGAVRNLGEKFPDLAVSGFRNGFFELKGTENDELIERINNSGTDVLLVGMGMPRQEKWVLDNRTRLNVKLIVTCGAMFYYYSGHKKRSPHWISRIGLEWFHRFLGEPVRLFSRYFPGNFTFFYRVLRGRLTR